MIGSNTDPERWSERPVSVALEDVSLIYTRRHAAPVPALCNVSLRIAQGEFFCLIGPSGCGKSTLLRLVSALIAPTSGNVTVDGLPASSARRGRKIAFVFQEPALLPWRTVRTNVRLPDELIGQAKAGADRVDGLLELVGLSGFADRYPAELSGGMRQRVAIARALNCHPSVLLMDEPFQALDEMTRHRLNDELQRIWTETNVTILFVTHSIEEAVYLGDRVGVLSARPGHLKTIVDVPFPRARTRDLRYSRPFVQLTQQITSALEFS